MLSKENKHFHFAMPQERREFYYAKRILISQCNLKEA